MECLYENKVNRHKCNCLTEKHCANCSFYKENTKENYKNYIMQVEKDIQLYKMKG